MDRPKFKDAFKFLDFFTPVLRSPAARKKAFSFLAGAGVTGGATAQLANNEKKASLDKAELVYYKLCQNK